MTYKYSPLERLPKVSDKQYPTSVDFLRGMAEKDFTPLCCERWKAAADELERLQRALTQPIDTGDCHNCISFNGGGCVRGQDTKRAACCYHSRAGENDLAKNREAELERLQAIVDKLPVDAEGNPVIPKLDDVWHPKRHRSGLLVDEDGECEFDDPGDGDWKYHPLSECYISKESMAAAQSALDKDKTDG